MGAANKVSLSGNKSPEENISEEKNLEKKS